MPKIIINKKFVIKHFSKENKDLFNNEIFWLKKLSRYNQFPKILNISRKRLSIKLINKGDELKNKNLPKNWESQIKKILKILKKNNCLHGDITVNNLVVKNKSISLIDFAQATQIKKFKEKKKRTFDDDYALNRISLTLNQTEINSNDLRTLVIWNSKNDKKIKDIIKKNKKFKIIDHIKFSKNFYKDLYNDRIMWLDSFYNRYIDRKTPKLKQAISCYIILNLSPIFRKEKMIFTHEKRVVDSDTFNLKKNIRRKKRNIIHISDNFEEAKRNALFLSKTDNHYPHKLFLNSQTVHKFLKSFFNKINREKKLEYVLLRPKIDNSGDIDLLVNNFFIFKRIADAHSYKLKNLSLISNNGDPLEDYGFKVSNFIKVEKNEVCLDIRYVGDNYFDKNWQFKILKNRTFKNGIFIPSKKDQLYTILYHIFFHKGFFDKKFKNFFKKYFKKRIDHSYLEKEIYKHLKNNNYKIVRPNDLTITPKFNLSDKQKKEEFQNIDIQISKNNFSCANKMLVNLIKMNFLYILKIKVVKLIYRNNLRFFITLIKKILLRNISREKFKL